MFFCVSEFLNNRIEEICTELRETNSEYAMALKTRDELYEKMDSILHGETKRALSADDLVTFREYLEQDFTVSAILQQSLYKQGYADCVNLLQMMGVLK